MVRAAKNTKITAVKEFELLLRSLHGRPLNERTHPSPSCCHVSAEVELCLDGVISPSTDYTKKRWHGVHVMCFLIIMMMMMIMMSS